MKAEDQLLCPEAPTCISGQDKGVSQLENATDKRREQGYMTVIEEAKRLEVGKGSKRGDHRQTEGSYCLILPSPFRTNMKLSRCL